MVVNQKQAPKESEGRHIHQSVGPGSSYWLVYPLPTSLGLSQLNVWAVQPGLLPPTYLSSDSQSSVPGPAAPALPGNGNYEILPHL